MSRRPALAVALAVLLALSGCGALGGGQSPETPPGVEEGRLADADALLAAHAAQLNATGFRSELTLNATARQRLGGELRNYPVDRQQVIVVEAGGTPYQFRTLNRRAGASFEAWANDSRQYTRASTGDRVRYTTGTPADVTTLAGVERLDEHLAAAEYRVTDTQVRDGLRLYTLESGTVTDALSAMPNRTSAVEEYGSTLVVDSEGRIRAMRVEATYRIGDERASFTLGYTLETVGGVTTERPDWVRAAAGGDEPAMALAAASARSAEQ